MIQQPPRSTRTDTLFPYTTLFRSGVVGGHLRDRELTLAVSSGAGGCCTGRGHAAGRIRRDRERLPVAPDARSEEHTSELQSLMRISYAVFCLKKKNTTNIHCSTEIT